MKKWWIAAPVAGVLTFGALGAFAVGTAATDSASPLLAPLAAVESRLPAMSVAEAATGDFVSYDEIRARAIAESGIRENELTNYEIKFDGRGYMPTYRVELETNAGGVDIDFDAKTGEIIDVREKSWKHSRTKLVISDYDVIEDVEAMGIALEDADLSMDDLDRFELELHTKRGELVYSVELKHGTEEYEYDLRASDGTILKREIDFD